MYVALGGALGAILRYSVVSLAGTLSWQPWGTWFVNVIGCFAIGSVVEICSNKPWFDEIGRPLIVIGFLGAFTTFSAFSVDVLQLLNGSKYILGTFYVCASIVSCLVAAWIGMRMFGD